MRRLILCRHAKAEVASGGGDFERTLTERGRRDAQAIGRRLAADGESPDIALVSTAARAAQTWDIAREAFGEVRTELLDALYNASAQAILDQIGTFEGAAGTVIVVGHNPGLHELAVRLLAESSAAPSEIIRMADSFPTAAAAVFAVDDAGRCALEAFRRPGEEWTG